MNLYRKLYLRLFNEVTDALREIEAWNFGLAAEKLKKAQQQTEKIYIEAGEDRENAETESRAL